MAWDKVQITGGVRGGITTGRMDKEHLDRDTGSSSEGESKCNNP